MYLFTICKMHENNHNQIYLISMTLGTITNVFIFYLYFDTLSMYCLFPIMSFIVLIKKEEIMSFIVTVVEASFNTNICMLGVWHHFFYLFWDLIAFLSFTLDSYKIRIWTFDHYFLRITCWLTDHNGTISQTMIVNHAVTLKFVC